jgi:uncharacterized protein (TIGR02996 family)
MNDRETWERAIEKDPMNDLQRKVYADFLDEQGQVEEADRQRKWADSFSRLKKDFFTDLWHPDAGPLPEDEVLLDIFRSWAGQAADDKKIIFAACGYGELHRDQANGDPHLLPDLAVVTGLPVPLYLDHRDYHCLC